VVRASEGTPFRISKQQTLLHYPRAGELQAVALRGFRAGAERKVRTPTGSMLANGEARRRDGKCNRKQTAGSFGIR